MTASTGIITTIAGTGSTGFSGDGGAASSAMLNHPLATAFDSSGTLHSMTPFSYPEILFFFLKATCTSLIKIIIASAR